MGVRWFWAHTQGDTRRKADTWSDMAQCSVLIPRESPIGKATHCWPGVPKTRTHTHGETHTFASSGLTPSTMTAYLSLPPHHHNVTFHQRTSRFPSLLSARSGRGFGVLGGVLGLGPFPFLLLFLPPLLYPTGCWAVLRWHVACQLSRQGPAYCTARLHYLSPVRMYM